MCMPGTRLALREAPPGEGFLGRDSSGGKFEWRVTWRLCCVFVMLYISAIDVMHSGGVRMSLCLVGAFGK